FSPQAILAAGWALWKLGDFDLVAAEIEPLADDPYWAVEHGYLLGMAAYGENKWPEAIKQLSQALQGSEKHPHRDAILFYLGENQLRDGQTDAAIESFRTLADQHARSIWADDALWGIARVARAVHQADQFEAAVAQLREQFPESRYLELLGQLQTGEADYLALPYENQTLDEAAGSERDGRLDAALAAYQEVIGQDRVGRVHAEALRRAAHLHDRMAHYPEASVLYEQFLTKYPKSIYAAEVLSSQAWMAERRGDLAFATAKFRTLHENFPQSAQAPEATYWLALAATDMKDSTKARYYIQWLLSALSKKTESRSQELWEQTLLLKCQLMAAEEEWQAILDLLAHTENGFEEGTRKARAAFWLAESHYRTGNLDTARTAFDELDDQTTAVEEPWVAMVPLRRAQLRSQRQQWTEVLKILGPEEQKPTDFQLQYEVNYLRGRAYAGRGEMTLARRAYRRVLEDKLAAGTETSAMAQWMIGETFFHQNDYLRARQAYQRVIDQHSLPEWQARAALQAGKCMELEQSWDEAAAYYTAAIERWQDSNSATQLEARLKWATSQTTQR
ncbi:MAG: tetratricopeptide repeat protein, partial [Planctomycetales bacterium]|nr:tetratricopeptide repeat protein [Planctomycetales bacterium]